MRHKLYVVIGEYIRSTPLSGTIKVDSAFTNINLKGTKTKNMPRRSKGLDKSKTDTILLKPNQKVYLYS